MSSPTRRSSAAVLAVAVAVAAPLFAAADEVGASAGIPAMDLSRYTLSGPFPLPPVAASEASAVTWDWDTNTLFVIGDEGMAIVRVSLRGEWLEEMTLEGFDDTEGLTYIGGGRLVVAEERQQDVVLLTFVAGGSVDRPDLQDASIGPVIGNVGLEGVSFDPPSGRFILVKEKTPQRVIEADVDFDAGAAVVDDLFLPALGVLDLSDVQVLTTVPSLAGRPDADNLLILSQESRRLLEVTRDGTAVGTFNLAGISDQMEGVTIDADGVIYLVDETPNLYVLTPGCLRDLTGDGVVGLADVNVILAGWGTTAGDIDGDGTTDFADLLIVFSAWGDCPSF